LEKSSLKLLGFYEIGLEKFVFTLSQNHTNQKKKNLTVQLITPGQELLYLSRSFEPGQRDGLSQVFIYSIIFISRLTHHLSCFSIGFLA